MVLGRWNNHRTVSYVTAHNGTHEHLTEPIVLSAVWGVPRSRTRRVMEDGWIMMSFCFVAYLARTMESNVTRATASGWPRCGDSRLGRSCPDMSMRYASRWNSPWVAWGMVLSSALHILIHACTAKLPGCWERACIIRILGLFLLYTSFGPSRSHTRT